MGIVDQSKNNRRIIFSLYINEEVVRKFRETTKYNTLIGSALVEKLLIDWISSADENDAESKPDPYSVI